MNWFQLPVESIVEMSHSKRSWILTETLLWDMCSSIQNKSVTLKSHWEWAFNNPATKSSVQYLWCLVRENVDSFICFHNINVYRLKHEKGLRKHLIRHERHKGDSVNCPICKKVIKHEGALRSHIQYTHGERHHQCVLCDKAFKSATSLKVTCWVLKWMI